MAHPAFMQDLVGTQFGATDIVGTQFGAADRDFLALVGAAAATSPAAAQMFDSLAARQAVAVVPRPATKGREYVLGFGPTTVLAGAAATITVQPQVPFKGRRLIIPSDIAGAVSVNDIKVGKNSQLAASNAVPGRTYSEFAVGVDLGLDTAQISQQITLLITNVSGSQISFSASMTGSAVE